MAFLDFLPLIGDVVSGLFGNKSTSSANATNLQLNRENNEANRQNMERQNQMNIEQWNRENAYNHPAAQMGRFTAAGLNPNLIYGQTNTAPQLSGSLGSSTSQAGSVMPNDAMSKMFGKLGETLMRIPMYREEVRGKRLENDERELDIAAKRDEKDIRDWLNSIFTDADVPDETAMKEVQGFMNLRQLSALNSIRQQSASLHGSEQQNRLFDKNFDNMVREVANRADISSADAKYWLNTLYGRIDRTNTDSKMNSLEDMPEFTQKGLKIIKIINEVVGQYIPMMKFK